MDSDELLGDLVGSIVEKILMNIGQGSYSKVSDILETYKLKFSDCYKNPDILNFALKEVFDYGYISIINKIKKEFGSLVDEDHRLEGFVRKLEE